MSQSLAQTLTSLAGGILESARATPVAVQRIEASLPMEFDLLRGAGGPRIAMTPPDAPQARGLALPLGRLSFTLDIGGGSDG